MRTFQKAKKTRVRLDDSHTCSDTSFWEAMGQARAQRLVFNGSKGCGHPTTSNRKVGWGTCTLFSHSQGTEVHPHTVPARPAPLLCQEIESQGWDFDKPMFARLQTGQGGDKLLP